MNGARRRRNRGFRLIGSLADALACLLKTEASENGHIVLMLAGILSAVYAAWGGRSGPSPLPAGNVLTSPSPILLQRYTRARLVRVTSRRRKS